MNGCRHCLWQGDRKKRLAEKNENEAWKQQDGLMLELMEALNTDMCNRAGRNRLNSSDEFSS